MKRRLVAVTLSLIMTMATVSEAGAAAFTSPDTAPAVATQTDAEEVNVTEETSETEADAFSDGDDGTAVPSPGTDRRRIYSGNGYGCCIAGRDAVNSRCYGCRWSRCSES